MQFQFFYYAKKWYENSVKRLSLDKFHFNDRIVTGIK